MCVCVYVYMYVHFVLLQGSSVNMCSTILDVLSSIYHQDSANYFILEGQNTLPQFAEKIHIKPVEIQVMFSINLLKAGFCSFGSYLFLIIDVKCGEFIYAAHMCKHPHTY